MVNFETRIKWSQREKFTISFEFSSRRCYWRKLFERLQKKVLKTLKRTMTQPSVWLKRNKTPRVVFFSKSIKLFKVNATSLYCTIHIPFFSSRLTLLRCNFIDVSFLSFIVSTHTEICYAIFFLHIKTLSRRKANFEVLTMQLEKWKLSMMKMSSKSVFCALVTCQVNWKAGRWINHFNSIKLSLIFRFFSASLNHSDVWNYFSHRCRKGPGK